jgi:hypothetical protein
MDQSESSLHNGTTQTKIVKTGWNVPRHFCVIRNGFLEHSVGCSLSSFWAQGETELVYVEEIGATASHICFRICH